MLTSMTRIQVAAGGCVLILMILLTCANILLRQFGLPVRGTFELMGFMGALIFALSLGYSYEKKEHLYVSILFDRFPKPLQRAARFLNSLVCSLFFGLMTWQLMKNALNLRSVQEVSETLRIPYYPVIIILALGTAFLVVRIVYELFNASGEKS